RLFVVTVADKSVKEVAKDIHGFLADYTWSPVGSTLAWSMTDADRVSRSIYLWTAGEAQPHKVTTDVFNEYTPSWDPDGNYLFYLSDRDYYPQLSQAEFNYATARTTGIFALALRKDVKNPFPMENDEATVDTAGALRQQGASRPERSEGS